MKKTALVAAFFAAVLFFAASASAHFGMVIPSSQMVMGDDKRSVDLTLSFSHPFEMVGMDLVLPKEFFVMSQGEKQDLTGSLVSAKVMDSQAWKTSFAFTRPGIYNFVMEPHPYWEPAEDCYIKHITRAVVAAFGDEDGWDEELGLETEIVPLSRPFGLYAGNVFQGAVQVNGETIPFAEVEVEYYNSGKSKEIINDYMITQVVKADENGVFTYAVPGPGWWGFAALNEADYTIKHGDEEKPLELGAVIWVYFHKF